MSEEKSKSGRVKGMVGALAGLLSGGAMMYLSPVVDRVIKPQKPLANFAVETNGLQITLHNRSAGGDGWWDFGDGSALEPAAAASDTVTHSYAKPGTYTVKLSLRNFMGDEAERPVQVEVNGQSTTAAAPAILKLDAVPLTAQSFAPATYQVIGTAQNAELAVWNVDEQLEIVKDSPNRQEKTVTFTAPGRHVIQYAVVSGGTSTRQSVTVDVRPAPANTLLAVLSVTDSGTRVERKSLAESVVLMADATAKPFEKFVRPAAGFRVIEAKLAGKEPAGVKNLAVQVAPDRSLAKVTGELSPATVKPGQKGVGVAVVPVLLTVERQSSENRKPVGSTTPLTVPGTASVPLAATPADWTNAKRQATVELRFGSQTIRAATALPCTIPLDMGSKRYVLKAAQSGNTVQIDVRE